LTAAIEEVTDGDIIKLTADITTLSAPVDITKDITLDLNGNDLIVTGADAIKVQAGGKLTINGNGTISGSGSNSIAVWARSGEIVINGGTYTNDISTFVSGGAQGASVVYASGTGKVTINGGTFECSTSGTASERLTLNVRNDDWGTASITVNGGTFKNYDPSTGDDAKGGTFVAAGKTVTSTTVGSDTYYTVS